MTNSFSDSQFVAESTAPLDFQFEAECEPVAFTNAEFCEQNLPFIRFASLVCSRDWREVESDVRRMLTQDDGSLVVNLLADFQRTREQMEAMAALIEVAEARIALTLKRIVPELALA